MSIINRRLKNAFGWHFTCITIPYVCFIKMALKIKIFKTSNN